MLVTASRSAWLVNAVLKFTLKSGMLSDEDFSCVTGVHVPDLKNGAAV